MRGTPELKGVPESSCSVKLTAKNISLNPTTLLKLTSSQVFFNDCSLIFMKASFTENLMAVSESYWNEKIQNVETFSVLMIKYRT